MKFVKNNTSAEKSFCKREGENTMFTIYSKAPRKEFDFFFFCNQKVLWKVIKLIQTNKGFMLDFQVILLKDKRKFFCVLQ